MAELPKKPMFKLLITMLKDEPEETKAMFFAETEEELFKAYQEGFSARKNKLPMSANPYPVVPSKNDNILYTKNLCWSEGFLEGFLSDYSNY